MDEKIIYNYLQGKTTSEEELLLLNWINESQENKAFFFEMKALGSLNQISVDEEELVASLNRINKKINREESRTKKRKLHLYVWSSVAVITILFILSYRLLPGSSVKGQDVMVYANNADTVRVVTLTDGTTVWLRENTTLTCESSFAEEAREVSLEGEAFFDVTKGVYPFVVKTDVTLIKVVGTSFSINTSINGFVETILMTGTVQLQQIGENSVTELQPGQAALYSKNEKSFKIRDVDPNMHTSWRYGLVSLSNVSIHTILQCIEDTYHVKLKMDTTLLKDHSYNFSFRHSRGIEETLGQLALVTGVAVELI